LKLAIAGKGGVGKTTLTAVLARRLASADRSVIAVDADPDGNLASAMGIAESELPTPIAQMRELILDRTDAKDEGAGLIFKLNPKVDDLPGQFSVLVGGVRVLALGTVETGGKGCLCPEGAVLKALMQHLLLRVDDDVILDMEAGLEHMGRASATGVDAIITVIEPGMRSVQTASRILKLAADIGIQRSFVVMNQLRYAGDRDLLEDALDGQIVLGALPYCEKVARADLEGRSADEIDDTDFSEAVDQVIKSIEKQLVR